MPRGDGKGPMGMGTMTGRGAGYCAGFGMPGFANAMPGNAMGYGRGRRCGFGSGMGRRLGWSGWNHPGTTFPFAVEPQNELEVLREQARNLSDALDEINKRITEIGSEKR